MMVAMMKMVRQTKRLAKDHCMKYISPIDDMFFVSNETRRIVSTFPGFQPRYHLLNKNIKFIGACISEKIRAVEPDDAVSEILAKYAPVNPVEPKSRDNLSSALIYVSLGTVMNDNRQLYSKIFEAINLLSDNSAKIPFSKMEFIISAGGKSYENLKKMSLPANIVISKHAPQLEILKRATLFVTHCGANSVNESIYFGVPTICMPIAGEQPMVAHRASMELGTGFYVDFVNLRPITLKNAIVNVINDESYFERAYRWSQFSRNYEGRINGAKEIIDFLHELKGLSQ